MLSKASVVPIVARIAAVAGAPGTIVDSGPGSEPGIFVGSGVESPPREPLNKNAATPATITTMTMPTIPIRTRGSLLFFSGTAAGAAAGRT